MSIFDAAMKYAETKTPLVILAGHEYGTGSSRDWAAKGTRLLGVKAVIAASFERIHRSNLVGMGVLPLQFLEGTTAQSLGLDGSERFSITGLSDSIKPGQQVTLEIESKNARKTISAGEASNRYTDRGRLLPARWNFAVCAQTATVKSLTPAVTDHRYRRIWRFWTVIGEPSAMNAERGDTN